MTDIAGLRRVSICNIRLRSEGCVNFAARKGQSSVQEHITAHFSLCASNSELERCGHIADAALP